MSAAAFGLPVLVTALAGVAAVLSSRISERLRIPAPAFFLFAAAAAADIWPRLGGLSFGLMEDIVLGRPRGDLVRRRHAGGLAAVAGGGGADAVDRRAGHPGHGGGRGRRGAPGRWRWTGAPPCCSAPRWRRPTRRCSSPSSAAARWPGAAARCSRVSPARTTRSASRCWPPCSARRRPGWPRPATWPPSCCPSWPSARPSAWREAGRCWPSCAACRCRARACIRCGSWPAPWRSTAWPPPRTGPASWPCSSRAPSSATRGRRTGGRSRAFIPRWRAWPRSSRSPSWA